MKMLFLELVRLALCPGKGGKPSVLITTSFDIYLGNPGDEEMVVTSHDIMGFYTGAYEVKIIKSISAAEMPDNLLSKCQTDLLFIYVIANLLVMSNDLLRASLELG